jgi:hypothetical protein
MGLNLRNDMKNENRRTFRLDEEELIKLKQIAKHYFGKESGMNTATLKLLIEKEWRSLNG